MELGFNRDFYKLLAEKEHKPICIFSYSQCLVAGDGIFAVKGFLGIMINISTRVEPDELFAKIKIK